MTNMSSDREILDQIEAIFGEKEVTPFDEDYNCVVESLSFSRTNLDGIDLSQLKREWTDFLRRALESDTSWEWPCNVGMAEWYSEHERPLHAIAVYEHLLREIHRKGLDESEGEYCGAFQEWLQRLFQLCRDRGLTERALYVAELIYDFQSEGFFGAAECAEVIASTPALRRREFGETIKRERDEASRRYRYDFASLSIKLHKDTERCLVQAELMSVPSILPVDPSAAPRCWCLAIESEFHHKLYENEEVRYRLDGILGEKRRPRRGKSCGIGQILTLIEETYSHPSRRPVLEKEIPAWRRLLAVPNVIETLKVVKKHRDQVVHVTESGMYTADRCREFLEVIRKDRWIIRLLQAIQPAT